MCFLTVATERSPCGRPIANADCCERAGNAQRLGIGSKIEVNTIYWAR